jgi:hypothetical protein
VILFNLPLAAAFDLASLSALFAATTAVAADFSDFFGGICLNGIGLDWAGMSFGAGMSFSEVQIKVWINIGV